MQELKYFPNTKYYISKTKYHVLYKFFFKVLDNNRKKETFNYNLV